MKKYDEYISMSFCETKQKKPLKNKQKKKQQKKVMKKNCDEQIVNDVFNRHITKWKETSLNISYHFSETEISPTSWHLYKPIDDYFHEIHSAFKGKSIHSSILIVFLLYNA